MPDHTQRKYLKGRWKIGGRQLRYEACLDICLAVVKILQEYASDCESEYFACVHDDDLARVKALIERADRIISDEEQGLETGDLPVWTPWLHEVADLLPRLWD